MRAKGCCKGNNYEQRFARTLDCLQYLDMKKNNSNNKYNK